MFNFIGTGGYINFELGATAAYYKVNKKLLLVDCGNTVFREIVKEDILADIKEIFIAITHFHDDHSGSLGTLISYCYNNLKIIPVIVYPSIKHMKKYLDIIGINPNRYILNKNLNIPEIKIKSFKQDHGSIVAYGYYFEINNKLIYYSGDGSKIDDNAIEKLTKGKINYFYQEVTLSSNPGHMNMEKLAKLVPTEVRNKVTCMHFDNKLVIDKASKLGFSIAKKE